MWSNTTTDGFADADTYIDADFNGSFICNGNF